MVADTNVRIIRQTALLLFLCLSLVFILELLIAKADFSVIRSCEAHKEPTLKAASKKGSTMKVYSREEAIDRIKEVAEAKNFRWPDYLIMLADCESGFNQFAFNKKSTATGWFQIIDSHGLSREDRCDLDIATSWTIDRINEGKQSMWHCHRLIRDRAKAAGP